LRDLEDSRPDPVPITDTDLIVVEPLDGEVLTELSVDEVAPGQLMLPIPVRADLIDEHCALLAPMSGEITLTVPVHVQLADPATTRHGILENPGVDGLALPGHVLRHADIDRQQDAHRAHTVRDRPHRRPRAHPHAPPTVTLELLHGVSRTKKPSQGHSLPRQDQTLAKSIEGSEA
jgi:hypothetical protein